MRSAVRVERLERDARAEVVGWGIISITIVSNGSRSATVSGSGGRDRGERMGKVREWRMRVWWTRFVERAVWALMSLFLQC